MYNFMESSAIERASRREIKILRLLEQLISYCKFLKTFLQSGGETIADDADRHPLAAISCLMKVSFDEEYRHTMCNYDGLQIISNLVYLDFAVHGSQPNDQCCNSLRRYALMALTNLTFGDENNKAILCRQKMFMNALVGQLETAPDDLLQVTASVLRNLSWRPDNNTKIVLNKIGAVKALAQTAMSNQNENTLKAILSALWNLSAHCSTNKVELCAVQGALAFLVDMLSYEAPSKTLKIVENAGGILRNVSSHIAVCEPYRQILRERDCLSILLQHLKSDNMTLVSNSCGTLWNLSARCLADQQYLLDNGAIPLLRSLTHSKHAMISEGSAAALKNLLGFRSHLQGNADIIALQSKWPKTEKSIELTQNPTSSTSRAIEKPLSDKQTSVTKIISKVQSITLTESTSRESVYANESTRSKLLTKAKSKSLDFLHIVGESTQKKLSTLTLSTDMRNSSERITYRSSYQETDLDQLTDFSLRYMENQIERDVESPPPIGITVNNMKLQTSTMKTKEVRKGPNEIVCIEDNVKCYHTEGTPYMISNAASVDDLTGNKSDNLAIALKSPHTPKPKKLTIDENRPATYGQYMNSDNPINFCDEGTPYYFSRRESLNSLHELATFGVENLPNADKKTKQLFKIDAVETEKAELLADAEPKPIMQHVNTVTVYSAQETPLMFSRSSSIDSLHDDDLPPCDDLSSVQSDFSRLASGIISPSDIPDSPTQLMPRSPNIKVLRKLEFSSATISLREKAVCELDVPDDKQKLKATQSHSVFEDNTNMFQVENTPAQFSCATSLSNLSIVDDDAEHMKLEVKSELDISHGNVSVAEEDEEEEEGAQANDDEVLLASCINIGMNRSTYSTLHRPDNPEKRIKDEITEYFTEDTPAMFSHQGSNTNLSAISILSCNNDDPKDNVSFNTSEGSVADEENLLQACINKGMQMAAKEVPTAVTNTNAFIGNLPQQPIAVAEEPTCSHNKSLQQLQRSPKNKLSTSASASTNASSYQNRCNESLSSLSTDSCSEDDADFLNQAIVAGYNRSKSKQQPPLKSLDHPSMSVQLLAKGNNNNQQTHNTFDGGNDGDGDMAANCSVDSSDSSCSDNQSKSLLELCIRTGMHRKDQQPSSSAAAAVTNTGTATAIAKHKLHKN